MILFSKCIGTKTSQSTKKETQSNNSVALKQNAEAAEFGSSRKANDDIDFDLDPNLFAQSTYFGELASKQANLMLHPVSDLDHSILQSLYRILLDVGCLRQLQECGAINHGQDSQWARWDEDARELSVECPDRPFSALLPANVAGDGNCLLHAVSRALWGVQDAPVTEGAFTSGPTSAEDGAGLVGALREGLRGLLGSPRAAAALRAAWGAQRAEWDRQSGVGTAACSEAQLDAEWENEVRRRARTDREALTEVDALRPWRALMPHPRLRARRRPTS
jgi:hypothetical protein